MYLCTIYGIVIIEVYSCNKELYLLNTVALYPSLFWLTPKERRTQRQALCIAVHLHIHICDTLPLDNSKIHLHTALQYITWGLIPDLKIKKEIPIEIKILSGIPKFKKEESFLLRRFKNFII